MKKDRHYYYTGENLPLQRRQSFMQWTIFFKKQFLCNFQILSFELVFICFLCGWLYGMKQTIINLWNCAAPLWEREPIRPPSLLSPSNCWEMGGEKRTVSRPQKNWVTHMTPPGNRGENGGGGHKWARREKCLHALISTVITKHFFYKKNSTLLKDVKNKESSKPSCTCIFQYVLPSPMCLHHWGRKLSGKGGRNIRRNFFFSRFWHWAPRKCDWNISREVSLPHIAETETY